MLEERDDLLDRVLHAEEFLERRVPADHPVAEEASEALIVPGVHELGIADAREHAFRGCGVHRRIALAKIQVLVERELFFLRRRVVGPERIEQLTHRISFASRRSVPGTALFRCRAGNARTRAAWSLIHYITHLVLPQGACQCTVSTERHRVLKNGTLRPPHRSHRPRDAYNTSEGRPVTSPTSPWKALLAFLLSATNSLVSKVSWCHDGIVVFAQHFQPRPSFKLIRHGALSHQFRAGVMEYSVCTKRRKRRSVYLSRVGLCCSDVSAACGHVVYRLQATSMLLPVAMRRAGGQTVTFWAGDLAADAGKGEGSGRRDWTRTNDPHHVKVVL